MKFFYPFTRDIAEAQHVYMSLKRSLADEQSEALSERKIYSLRYTHNGKRYYAQVGRLHAANREVVLAILYDPLRDLYLICTPNRGANGKNPMLVGGSGVKAVVSFEA